jgi:hypothetical protein
MRVKRFRTGATSVARSRNSDRDIRASGYFGPGRRQGSVDSRKPRTGARITTRDASSVDQAVRHWADEMAAR